jgi:hypothetical protein
MLRVSSSHPDMVESDGAINADPTLDLRTHVLKQNECEWCFTTITDVFRILRDVLDQRTAAER